MDAKMTKEVPIDGDPVVGYVYRRPIDEMNEGVFECSKVSVNCIVCFCIFLLLSTDAARLSHPRLIFDHHAMIELFCVRRFCDSVAWHWNIFLLLYSSECTGNV